MVNRGSFTTFSRVHEDIVVPLQPKMNLQSVAGVVDSCRI